MQSSVGYNFRMHCFRLIRSLLLAFLLLSTQLWSISHAVAHTLEQVQHESEQPMEHQQTCDLCHACAELGSSPPPTIPLFAPQTNSATPAWLPLPQGIVAIAPSYFLSRAPPVI